MPHTQVDCMGHNGALMAFFGNCNINEELNYYLDYTHLIVYNFTIKIYELGIYIIIKSMMLPPISAISNDHFVEAH